MPMTITITKTIRCNKWTCGRCEDCFSGWLCKLFHKAVKQGTRGAIRLPECLRADDELCPCEVCWRREAVHVDDDGVYLCDKCYAGCGE